MIWDLPSWAIRGDVQKEDDVFLCQYCFKIYQGKREEDLGRVQAEFNNHRDECMNQPKISNAYSISAEQFAHPLDGSVRKRRHEKPRGERRKKEKREEKKGIKPGRQMRSGITFR